MKNFRLAFGCFLLTLLTQEAYSQNNSLNSSIGLFENQTNVGNPKIDGTVNYNSDSQEYTLRGAGFNMSFENDEFQYAYKSIQGDFILRTRVKFVGKGIDAHSKVGWIVRNSLHSDSRMVNATTHGDGLTALQYRKTKGSHTEQLISNDSTPDIIQLERRAGVYYMSTAKFGQPFSTIKIEDVNLRNEVFVGIYICSYNPEGIEKAVFSNVRIIKPTKSDFQPYRDYLGSNMEIIDVTTGQRKVLWYSAHSLQAPNWVNKDKELVFNSNGYLYRYSFKNEETEQIDTGFAINNNNDHVFSFDESILGISNHNQEDGGTSSIYLMNPQGDTLPRKITLNGVGASYLHGISPDNKTIIYTANRNEKYDIYGTDIATRKEFQITDTQNLDDGSEYSPDGKYIYFNSNRTGTMQLWRMKTDGSNPERLTFDENYKDWFPHISPDGKWIAFISFPPDIDFGSHPFYKHCTLRLMPTSGGDPKIIAYVYGGQGTINVPSWSSDSKRISFVSNSD